MFPGKFKVDIKSASVGVKAMAQRNERRIFAGDEKRLAKSDFSATLNAKQTQVNALHEAVIARAAKVNKPGNRPEDHRPQQPVNSDKPAEEPVDVPLVESAEGSDTDSTPVAAEKATQDDQASAVEDTPSNMAAPEIPLPTVPTQAGFQPPAQPAVPTASTGSNAQASETTTQSPTTLSVNPAVNRAPANSPANPVVVEQAAATDPIDENTSVSTPSQEASTLPPTPAAPGRKQAHENRDYAAHIKAMETDASPEKAAAPQASAPPVQVGAGTVLDAPLTDETASASLMKEQSVKPVEAAGVPLVLGETARVAKDAQGAELAPAAQDSPRTPNADTMDQIVLGLKGKMDARTGKAEIRLDPPNLGTMKVSVTLENGLLTAEFQSPSSVVRNLLQGNLEQLKTVLEGQGVAVDRLAVNAPADAGSSGQNPQASFGSATHDGRSAGQYQQDARSNNGRSGEGFARVFTQAQEAPLDLVA